jgi:hypothetical protein
MLLAAGELESSLFGLHENLCRILSQDAEFMASMTFREQYARACIVLHVLQEPPVSYLMIARIFKVSKGTIQDYYRNFQARQNDPRAIGRPPRLNG